jgi:DNA-binding NarL/FixJ family response regulator
LLGRRQAQALTLAAHGLSNAEIAAELGLQRDTVKETLSLAYAKLGARDRAHAVALALARGEIEFP